MATRNLPSQDYLKQCFEYEPDTGRLMWRSRPAEHFTAGPRHSRDTIARMRNNRFAGKACGVISRTKGSQLAYFRVGLDRTNCLAHRIIWKMQTGEEPTHEVDHRDGNGLNNRWDNLRSATHLENMWNGPDHSLKGTRRDKKNWAAQITIDGRHIHVGNFSTREEAAQAYRDAADLYRGEFASHRSRS